MTNNVWPILFMRETCENEVYCKNEFALKNNIIIRYILCKERRAELTVVSNCVLWNSQCKILGYCNILLFTKKEIKKLRE